MLFRSSGKSTLLRCINLLEPVDDGEIFLSGADGVVDIAEPGLDPDPIRRRIGMVFQSYNLFPHLTAAENVALGQQHVRRIGRREARVAAEHWLTRVGLAHRIDHYPYQLSGGQQQRVAIARALAMEPRLLLFDEVTSALDPELVEEVLGVMQDLAASGMTMVVVSHELLFVHDVAHRAVFMDGGRIAAQGPPAELFRNPENARLQSFLGRFRAVFG